MRLGPFSFWFKDACQCLREGARELVHFHCPCLWSRDFVFAGSQVSPCCSKTLGAGPGDHFPRLPLEEPQNDQVVVQAALFPLHCPLAPSWAGLTTSLPVCLCLCLCLPPHPHSSPTQSLLQIHCLSTILKKLHLAPRPLFKPALGVNWFSARLSSAHPLGFQDVR